MLYIRYNARAKSETAGVNIRAEAQDVALWVKAAKANGLTLSAWLRFDLQLKAAKTGSAISSKKCRWGSHLPSSHIYMYANDHC